jgi:XTP/dITP diphosphohydrolase
MPPPRLLIATHNPGKMREYRHLLRDTAYQLQSLDDAGIAQDVEETGETFAENARIKAAAYTRLIIEKSPDLPLLVLADDSGLEVDALGGRPGVHSARYGGPACATDQDRVRLLLSNLEGVPWEKRTARFRCVIAIAIPPSIWGGNQGTASGGQIPPGPPLREGGMTGFTLRERQEWSLKLVVGSVAGMIQYQPQGDQGFGYDPVFYLPSYRQTMAQLPLEDKNRISHRSDAAGKAVAVLQQLSAGAPASPPTA